MGGQMGEQGDEGENLMGKLNPKQVENLTEPGTYEDGDGLRLVVKPTGRKSWILRFQLAGRRREMGLGSFPEITLKKARQDASNKRSQLSDGVDPLATRDNERAAQREAQRASERGKTTEVRNTCERVLRGTWGNLVRQMAQRMAEEAGTVRI